MSGTGLRPMVATEKLWRGHLTPAATRFRSPSFVSATGAWCRGSNVTRKPPRQSRRSGKLNRTVWSSGSSTERAVAPSTGLGAPARLHPRRARIRPVQLPVPPKSGCAQPGECQGRCGLWARGTVPELKDDLVPRSCRPSRRAGAMSEGGNHCLPRKSDPRPIGLVSNELRRKAKS